MSYLLGLLLTLLTYPIQASDFELRAELGETKVHSNYFRVPQPSTRVDFPSDKKLVTGRVYGTWRVNEDDSLRLLIAPFSVKAQVTPGTNVDFNGATFVAGTSVDINYKFNSYRLSYLRKWKTEKAFRPQVGFTAKIRDAEIKLTGGGQESKRANVGFVPLLNVGFDYVFSENWLGYFDLDAAAASQGRALDGILELRYQGLESAEFGLGYRVLDGGVDTKENENFAQLRTWLFSISKQF